MKLHGGIGNLMGCMVSVISLYKREGGNRFHKGRKTSILWNKLFLICRM